MKNFILSLKEKVLNGYDITYDEAIILSSINNDETDVLDFLFDSANEIGVVTYHHNLESSRRFYEKICTSHTYDDRVNTIKNAKAVGLDVCSGGIFGMGENMKDRIDMAFDLKELDIYSIPINVLTPAGTPLENIEPVLSRC